MYRIVMGVAALVGAAARAAGGGPDVSPFEMKFMAEMAAKAKAAEAADAQTIVGRDGWFFFAPELHHAGAGRFWGDAAAQVSRASKPEFADPLPAILDFHEQLKARNVDLLLVPVPPKAVVYPEKSSGVVTPAADGAVPRLDSADQAFYDLLRREGVAVMDLVPLFMKNRAHAFGPVYCRTDTHWSGVGCVLAAGALAEAVRGKAWLKDVPKRPVASEWRDVAIQGDLARLLPAGAAPPPPETLHLRFVGAKGASGLEPIQPQESSPVLLMGDSHTLVFHSGEELHAVGAGLPDQLAAELGFPVDLIGTKGSGATPVRITLYRRAAADKAYLAGKRLVIWCLSAREFTEAFQGWMKVPVAP